MKKSIVFSSLVFVFLCGFVVSISAQSQYDIPDWIKKVITYWSEGNTTDDEFGNALSFLINKNIITIPQIKQLQFENTQLQNEVLKLQSKNSQSIQSTDTDETRCLKPISKPAMDYHGCVLSGVDFKDEILYGANLNSVNLEYAELSNAELAGADMAGANLAGVNLSGANLRYVDLHLADLHNANLTGADLTGATLEGTNLRYVNFHLANLHNANLVSSDLEHAILTDTNLITTDLSGANLEEANLTGANLDGANLSDTELYNTNFNDVYIHQSNFMDCVGTSFGTPVSGILPDCIE